MLDLRLLQQNLGATDFVRVQHACGSGQSTYRLLLPGAPAATRAQLRFAIGGGAVNDKTVVVAPLQHASAHLEKGDSGWELVVEDEIPNQDRWTEHRHSRALAIKVRLEGPERLRCLICLELVVPAPTPTAMLLKTRLLVLCLVAGLAVLVSGALLAWQGMKDVGRFQVTWSLPAQKTCAELKSRLPDISTESAPEGKMFKMWTTESYDSKAVAEVQNKVKQGLDEIKEEGHILGSMRDHTPRCRSVGLHWNTAGPGGVMVVLGITALALGFGHFTEIRGHRD